MRAALLVLVIAICATPDAGRATWAATVPAGFSDAFFVGGLANPTAMQFAPDGRLFVCEQAGRLRVVQNGALLATPFVTLTVNSSGERGLLGVAFDPEFANNGFVYVYYTAMTPTIHNRVSRFVANGNVALPGSEEVILELNPLSSATNHNGGAIHFGADGKLYVAVGDNATGSNAQTLTNLLGKVLRINRDGTIPLDNPFYAAANGVNRAIWAWGLRNPFTIAFERPGGRLFINDVGQNTYEEINEGAAGANYGWPDSEGPSSNPAHTDPVHYYGHGGGACAITGGAFYDPADARFPSDYFADYFFADYCAGWIRRLDRPTNAVAGFASGISLPVDLKVGPDGALYYLARGTDSIGRIAYSGSGAPTITRQPVAVTVAAGQAAPFSVTATGNEPLAYRWRRNGTDIAGASAANYTIASAGPSDDGAQFDVVVSNAAGTATSDSVRLTVTPNSPPEADIEFPLAGTSYAGGDLISYAGTGVDAEDGVLPATAFTWWVDLHHDAHTHPQVLPHTGSRNGSFVLPVRGEASGNVFYRIHLRVVDSGGRTHEITRDLLPRKAAITLRTIPAGLQLRLDGQSIATPYSFVGVVGIERDIEAVSPQASADGTLQFTTWSDGGARSHTIATPASDTTYTATFATQPVLAIGDAALLEGDAGSTNAVFTVTLSTASATPVAVNWTTTNGSAKSGSDFVASAGIVNFTAGATLRTLTVPVAGDATVEGKEVFYVDLSGATAAALGDARGAATILNDDGGGTLNFSSIAYRKSEASAAKITVRRSGGGAAITVRYATGDGTARAGSDYSAASGELRFAAGVSELSFTVAILNDALVEGDEAVSIMLFEPTGGAVLGPRSNAVLTIVDNDD